MFSYYWPSQGGNGLSEQIASTTLQDYYPITPLLIDGSFYISTIGLIFKNNAMQELKTSLVTKYYPSSAITIRRSQGNLYLNSFTVQDYKGFDLTNLETILGSTYFSNIILLEPTDRDTSGAPNTTPNSPNFAIDYGFKNSIINLATPTIITTTDFPNYFDYIEMNGLTIK